MSGRLQANFEAAGEFSPLSETDGAEALSALYAKIDRDLHAWLKRYVKLKGISVREFIEEKIREEMRRNEGAEEGLDVMERRRQYERLKRQHEKIIQRRDSLLRQLQKKKVYNKLVKFAMSLGLDIKNLSNLEQIMPKMIEAYRGRGEEIHLFITYLETVKKKEEIQKQLTYFRTRQA